MKRKSEGEEKKEKRDRKNRGGGNGKRTAMAAAAALLAVGLLLGGYSRKLSGSESGMLWSGTRTASGMKEGGEASPADASSVYAFLPDEDQLSAVRKVVKALEKGNLAQAAEVLSGKQDLFAEMFYEKMDGQRYLFDGTGFLNEIEGEGIVFVTPKTVFFGSFQEGKPEGECIALQSVDLEAPRYDYARGQWEEGRMNGQGETGYCYYGKKPENDAEKVCRSGSFADDRMDGTVTYESTGSEGITARWQINVKAGAVELDDRWICLEDKKEYQLVSENNDSCAYILTEDQISQPMWKNMLVWEEE